MHEKVGNIVQGVTKGVIFHQVNCQGVMGSGVAAAIRGKWPIVFDEYLKLHLDAVKHQTKGKIHLGKMQMVQVAHGLYVCNLFGQQFFGNDGKRYTSYDALDTALASAREWMEQYDVSLSDAHHPLIGSGLGGGKWSIVREIITANLGNETTLWTLP